MTSILNRDMPDSNDIPGRFRRFGELVIADSLLYGRICGELVEDGTALEILGVTLLEAVPKPPDSPLEEESGSRLYSPTSLLRPLAFSEGGNQTPEAFDGGSE